MRMPYILIIEDDPHISELISLYLVKERFRCAIAENGSRGLDLFYKEPPDLILLDIMLPRQDGWQVMEEIRKIRNTPVIMITGKGESYDKLKGFSLGVDDYVVKPFEPKELVARIKAVLRRLNPVTMGETVQLPGLKISPAEYKVFVDGDKVSFPPKEIELLHYLVVNRNQVYTREQLLNQVWGLSFEGDLRTVDVHVKRIRDKIGERQDWRIVTVWGIGYKFEVNEGCVC
ncbi:response regulator transcription factor [Paenibacillus sp. J2TS4]|uniref:response regulator transcription factor n=1 Tax=Paenibacillus sp. J2TS4 TaxID=2807194 RepID=UPI001B1F2445|nr:response regulator transcription factor [Paenibacillus sp. J2TS4]GIP32110.1 DNA-binding response regulator [Paenibacillus sp. J2TS4]